MTENQRQFKRDAEACGFSVNMTYKGRLMTKRSKGCPGITIRHWDYFSTSAVVSMEILGVCTVAYYAEH